MKSVSVSPENNGQALGLNAQSHSSFGIKRKFTYMWKNKIRIAKRLAPSDHNARLTELTKHIQY